MARDDPADFAYVFLNFTVLVSLVFQIPAGVWFLGLVCRALIPPHKVFWKPRNSINLPTTLFKIRYDLVRFCTLYS